MVQHQGGLSLLHQQRLLHSAKNNTFQVKQNPPSLRLASEVQPLTCCSYIRINARKRISLDQCGN